MAQAALGLLGQLTTAFIVFAVNMLFALTASLIRSLPWLIPLLWRLMRRWLIFTSRLYVIVLTPLTRWVQRRFRVNLLARTPRRITVILISLGVGVLLIVILQSPLQLWGWVAGVPFGVWLLALCVLHGFLVDRVWDPAPEKGGLHMGERL